MSKKMVVAGEKNEKKKEMTERDILESVTSNGL